MKISLMILKSTVGCPWSLVALWLVLGQNIAVALPQQEHTAKESRPAQSGSVSDDEPGARQNEQEVLEFVGKHQPKLRELIEFLKNKEPTQYRQAIREMSRSKQRLSNLEKRDEELHKVELELWQTRSELRLLAAELSVAADSRKGKLEKRLLELAQRQVKMELERMKIQRARTAKQLAQLEQQITERETGQAEQVAKIVKQWNNRTTKQTTGKPEL